MNLGSLEEQLLEIEQAVLKRQSKVASQLIPQFLSKFLEQKPALLFRACDWYRRLGMFERALRLVQSEPRPGSRHHLWSARLLNALGATAFARNELKLVKPRTAEDFRITGEIELVCFEPARALFNFERMRELDSEPDRYLSRLSLLGLADALSGLKKFDEAAELAREVHDRSPEPLLRGIALQARGEYLARAAKFAKAGELLDAAEQLFPPGDKSPDVAVLLKWQGYVYVRLGRRREGAAKMRQAIELLRYPGIRFEAWLDILRLQHEVGLLSAPDRARLGVYPGLDEGFRAQLRPLAERSPVRAGDWFIDLNSDEIIWGGRRQLGVPLELRALAYLALSGEWGISMVRLKSLLWPDQASAFLQLEGRMHQLFRRLRLEHGVAITLKDNLAIISKGDSAKFVIAGGTEGPSAAARPSFLIKRQSFTRLEHENYYGLSRPQSSAWIVRWLERGWVTREGSARSTSYRVAAESKVGA